MKKAFSLLAALILCLSLCACGVDDAYKPLLESVESGDYAGIKAELSQLSPEYAAEQKELEAYRRYSALIEALESGDYAAAQSAFAERLPAPTEPTYSTVEITLENWDTYFEFVTVEDWQINGFGEAEGYSLYYKFKLREEYLGAVQPADGLDLSVELHYPANYHRGSVDLTAREVTIGDIAHNISGQPTGDIYDVRDITWVPADGFLCEVSTFLIQWDNGEQDLYVIEEMPAISRIQGSLQLLDSSIS